MKDAVDSLNGVMKERAKAFNDLCRITGIECDFDAPQIQFSTVSDVPSIVEVNKTEVVERSENGSKVIRVKPSTNGIIGRVKKIIGGK